jgi:hypothetical protein
MARRAKPRITPAELDRAIGALPFGAFKRLGLDGIAKRFKVPRKRVAESMVAWIHRMDAVHAEVQLHLQNIWRPVPFPLIEKLPAARARVGSDNLARLKWLLAFAQGENKDASDLAVEVFAFAAPSDEPIHEPDLPNESLGELAPEKINELAKQVRAGINELHAGREWETRPLPLAFVGDNGSRSYRGRVADCFLAEAFDLALAERARTRMCEWSECKRLFVKNKRAKYCSRQCSAKARFLRWRDNKFKSDGAFSLWRHQRYKASHPRAKRRTSN